MRFRKLRIAFSATCLIACVLLIALWVRSYCCFDQSIRRVSTTDYVAYRNVVTVVPPLHPPHSASHHDAGCRGAGPKSLRTKASKIEFQSIAATIPMPRMRERMMDLCIYFRALDCPRPSWRLGTPRGLLAASLADPCSSELVGILLDEKVVTNTINSKMSTMLPVCTLYALRSSTDRHCQTPIN